MTSTEQRNAYYAAAVIGLHALEAREGRGQRFGPDADATWRAFAGPHHTAGDRLELLLRDAAVAWGPAFDARLVFDLDGVATDDAFGPSWLHRQSQRALEASGPASLRDAATALGLAIQSVPVPLTPTVRLLVAGPSAMVATATAIAANPACSWDRQVTVVADAPAHRQLAGLCALFTTADLATTVLHSTHPLPEGTAVVSPDAEPAVRAALAAR